MQLQLFWEIWTHLWSSKLAFDEETSSCDFPFDGTRAQKRTHFFSIALLFCWIWRVGKTLCNVRKYDDIYLNSHWLLAQRYRMLSVLKIKIRAKWTKIEAQTFFLKFWIITRGELLLFKHRKPVFKRFLSAEAAIRFTVLLFPFALFVTEVQKPFEFLSKKFLKPTLIIYTCRFIVSMANISITKPWNLADDSFTERRRMTDSLKFYNCVIYSKLSSYANYSRRERKAGVGLSIWTAVNKDRWFAWVSTDFRELSLADRRKYHKIAHGNFNYNCRIEVKLSEGIMPVF